MAQVVQIQQCRAEYSGYVNVTRLAKGKYYVKIN